MDVIETEAELIPLCLSCSKGMCEDFEDNESQYTVSGQN